MEFIEPILQAIEKALGIIVQYLNEILTILAPLTSFRIINFLKNLQRRRFGNKPHWLLLDLAFVSLTFGLAFIAWELKYRNTYVSLIVAFTIMSFAFPIVKWIFRRTKVSAPAVHEALFDSAQDDTMFIGAKRDEKN